jgi:uncharacterized OsmC-like protein
MNQRQVAEPHVFVVDTVWTGGIRTSTGVRGHEVVADGPNWRYGTDDGPAPGELMLASVGSCFVNHLVRYLQFKRALVTSVEARVTGTFRFEAELEVFDRFTFHVTVRAPERMRPKVEKAFKVAQVECTLLAIVDVEKTYELEFMAEEDLDLGRACR